MKYSWKLVDCKMPPMAKAVEVKAEDADGKSLGARSSHGCSVFDGSLFVLGGEIIARTPVDSTLWTRSLTKPSEWTAVETSTAREACPSPRVAHAQAVVGDDLLIFGGREGITMAEAPLDDLWSFSLTKKTWVRLTALQGSPPCARSFHRMVALGGKLYVYGGCAAKGRLADLHCFDLKTKSWSLLSEAHPDMAGRGGAGFVVGSDGKSLFVVGGFIGKESNAVYRFDLQTNTWAVVLKEGNEQVRPFSVSCGVTLPGMLVFFGGEVDPSSLGHEGAGSFSNDVVVLHGENGLPVKVAAAAGSAAGPVSRGWADAAAWEANKLVVYGGLSGSDKEPTRLADTWVLEFSE